MITLETIRCRSRSQNFPSNCACSSIATFKVSSLRTFYLRTAMNLVDEIGSMRRFWTLSKTQQKNVLTKEHSLTEEKHGEGRWIARGGAAH